MNSLSGFIKLHRKLVAWGWYQDYVVKDVFLHLLLTANFKPTPWKDRILEEGQVVIGSQSLAAELGFSRQQVRTALCKLKSTNEITIESTNKYSVITIVNWRDYQSSEKFSTSKSTNTATINQPTNNQQITNNQPQRKNGKNVKNGKKRENRGALTAHGTFKNVLLSDVELSELKRQYPNDYETKIERLSVYLESSGRTYKNHFAKLIEWLKEDVKPEPEKKSYDINELEKIDTLDFIE